MEKHNYVVGITGGIGSGKSSASAIMGGLGAVVVDADDISHRVTEGGMPAVFEIADAFGDRFVDMYGRLRRHSLAKFVFGNPERVARLEEIVHRYVVLDIISRVSDFREHGRGVMVLDVPIPVEHGFRDQCDLVWVVDADTETRIARVMQRSDMTRDEVIKRMNSQMSREEYLAIADRIIHNDSTPEELYAEVCAAAGNIAADASEKLSVNEPETAENRTQFKENRHEESNC